MAEDSEVLPLSVTAEPVSNEDDVNIEQALDASEKAAEEAAEPEGGVERISLKPETPPAEKPKDEPKTSTNEPGGAATPETGKVTPPEPEKPKEDVKPDTELDSIAKPKLSPKGEQGWEALKSVATARLKRAEEAEAKLTEISPLVGKPDPKVLEENTTLKQELAKYQALFRSEHSPEFIEKYDSKITANDASAYEVLKRNGLPETDEEAAKLKVPWSVEKVKRLGGIQNVPADVMTSWMKAIGNVNTDDAEALKDSRLTNKKLSTERQKELDEIKAKPEEFQKAEQAERTQKFQTYQKEMADYVTQTTKDLDWCKIQEIPANATPEVKARIEKQNEFYKASEVRFQAMLYPKDAVTRAQTALAACLSYKLADDLEAMQTTAKHWHTEYQKLQEQLGKIQKAGVTSRSGTTVPQGGPKKVDLSGLSDDDAIEAQMTAAGL